MSVYVCTGDIYGIVCMCAYRIYMYIVCMCAVRVRFTCHYIAIYIYLLLEKLYCHYFAVYIKFDIYDRGNIYVTILTCITKLL